MKKLAHFRSTREMLNAFNTEEKCREYLAEFFWNGKPVCPYCSHDEKIWCYKNKQLYKCSSCKKQFTVTVGTIFHKTHINLCDWFYAIYLFVNNKKGISARQMAKNLNISIPSAWFLLQRIRQMMRQRDGKLFGEVEIDETFVGGKNKNRHNNKKIPHSQGRSLADKTALYGMVERTGLRRVRIIHLGSLKAKGMRLLLGKVVDKSSDIYSDEYRNYNGLGKVFNNHFKVNHGAGQYVDGNNHTNTIECFWSHLKRGIVGTYHSVSKHKLFRYGYEFEFRWNTRHQSDPERFLTALSQAFGITLNWKEATCGDRRRNG